MPSDASTIALFILAIASGCFALVVWLIFLRPVPRMIARGEICQKVFKPGSTYWQYPTGLRRNFWTPAKIPIAECFVFAIRIEGKDIDAYSSLNTTAAEAFDVGHRVDIEYEVRGIPGVWQRIVVVNMTRVEEG